MMQQIGVRDFKAHTSDILRRVRDEGETVEITYRGRAIARVIPVTHRERPTPEEVERRFAALEEFASEMSARWPKGLSAADAVKADRREL